MWATQNDLSLISQKAGCKAKCLNRLIDVFQQLIHHHEIKTRLVLVSELFQCPFKKRYSFRLQYPHAPIVNLNSSPIGTIPSNYFERKALPTPYIKYSFPLFHKVRWINIASDRAQRVLK
jgi:hypothetical protein